MYHIVRPHVSPLPGLSRLGLRASHASAVGYDLPPLRGSMKNMARYVTSSYHILCGLPFFAEPRNLEMGKLYGCSQAGGAPCRLLTITRMSLQHYEQMLGAHRGRLAVTLDRVTNAMVLVGQHGVYCHSQRDPTKPTMDIQIITDELRKAKELIQSVMEDLRVERENRLRAN